MRVGQEQCAEGRAIRGGERPLEVGEPAGHGLGGGCAQVVLPGDAITSSARTIRACGTLMPGALATSASTVSRLSIRAPLVATAMRPAVSLPANGGTGRQAPPAIRAGCASAAPALSCFRAGLSRSSGAHHRAVSARRGHRRDGAHRGAEAAAQL